ncbi:acylneuraminate cytidylyltransferase family protein [Aestuariibacter halophilus]|uniref:Acylneuraminate cytidylyltransferase family protein n=1 Tax=Fluctibacter halophilus TaxID=226011 RepID=A0ABS8G3M2_9ALTE|nr:acylneuraminate cytidylyltransferase family protein [Aestuariibacter halophilus]MCC2615130.1 acylneuraminate cytidylyltransferase family protein [Aestuariibacter halophilus]
MKTRAFVFARGGSKGLPRKNVKLLAGKPLLSYSIDLARKMSMFEKVYVSTEDNEIASVASDFGATVIKRPDELAKDDSDEWLSWQHAVNWSIAADGPFDRFVSLPATSPLRNQHDVQLACDKFSASSFDACITVTPSSRSPFFNMVTLGVDSEVTIVSDGMDIRRRQDAPKVYDITTVAYVTSPEFILRNAGLFKGHVCAVPVPKARAVDIDDMIDFKLAETLLMDAQDNA